MLLNDIRQNYINKADIIPNWAELNQNDVANLYIMNEKNDRLKEAYFSILVLDFWNSINNIHNKNKDFITLEEAYNILLDSIVRALNYRPWLDENSTLFNDTKGPEKAINRCIFSVTNGWYQYYNKDKRKYNKFYTYALDEHDFIIEDNARTDDLDIKNIVQKFINNNNNINALLTDIIAFQDSYDSKKHKISERKIITTLANLNNRYVNYFINTYKINTDKLLDTIFKINNTKKTSLYNILRKYLKQMRTNKDILSILDN